MEGKRVCDSAAVSIGRLDFHGAVRVGDLLSLSR